MNFTKSILSVLVFLSLLSCEQAANSSLFSSDNNGIEDYQAARKIFWQELYPSGGETLYCGQKFAGGYRKGVNVEHVFPMSWVTNGLNCGKRKQCRKSSKQFNLIEADLHNLYPSRSDVNQDRSSYRFGEIKGEKRSYGSACDFEVDTRARVAEPAPAIRGEVARAMFYMAHRYQEYGLTIFASSGRVLHKWHKSDPPTNQEQTRNDQIERIQGNRNPFVDDPESLNKLISEGFFY